MMSAFVVKRTQLYLSVPHSWAKNSAMNNIMFVQLIRYTQSMVKIQILKIHYRVKTKMVDGWLFP